MEELPSALPTLSFDGAIAWMTFNRPQQRNAISLAVWKSLPILLMQAQARPETRILILRGAGGNFGAGADIQEFDTVFSSRAATLSYAAAMAAATTAIETASVPVIAMLQGLCIGAGVAVALACDLRLASADARFAITPAKLGLLYSLNDTRRLVDAVGLSAAKDLLFTGRMIDAARAEKIGLIDEVFDDALLAPGVAERAQQIAEASPWSVAKAKAIVALIAEGVKTDSDSTRGWFADAAETGDFREGLEAFRARRKPRFSGRDRP
jgi:enoyl-CoA hydratase/carnithine racemase